MSDVITASAKPKLKKDGTPTLKLGAKSKCTPELIQRAYELSALLFLDYQIYNSLGISRETYYVYIKNNQAFSEAIRNGKAKTLEDVSRATMEKAKDDTYMMTFVLKNKGDWIETQQKRNLEIKEREIEIKEKIFKLSTEKFIYELCEKHGLNKEETLEMLNKSLAENKV